MAEKSKPEHEFALDDIAKALFARAGIESGLWRLAAKLQFAALTSNLQGQGGPKPAGVVALEGLALFRADKPGNLVFDAGASHAPQPHRTRVAVPKPKPPAKVPRLVSKVRTKSA